MRLVVSIGDLGLGGLGVIQGTISAAQSGVATLRVKVTGTSGESRAVLSAFPVGLADAAYLYATPQIGVLGADSAIRFSMTRNGAALPLDRGTLTLTDAGAHQATLNLTQDGGDLVGTVRPEVAGDLLLSVEATAQGGAGSRVTNVLLPVIDPAVTLASDDASGSIETIDSNGNGLIDRLEIPASLDFGSVKLDSTATLTLSLSNGAEKPGCALQSVSIENAPALTLSPALDEATPLAPGESLDFEISFTATETRTVATELTALGIHGETLSVAVTATASDTLCELAFDPRSVDFGAVTICANPAPVGRVGKAQRAHAVAGRERPRGHGLRPLPTLPTQCHPAYPAALESAPYCSLDCLTRNTVALPQAGSG
ncbi:hypothetical protein RM530_11850 [Algiphilus sp. W345]|uniref:Uncharacterized protein n=1 Tax=Banduia mediterranea TaxID=3075609 RepID=A0ABU2WJJ7_9GAMM|nr:hypothetical protein [Algiphilus sp. W345]MDT0498051.1 hypothetical protein [Algiphilus sp. W345]